MSAGERPDCRFAKTAQKVQVSAYPNHNAQHALAARNTATLGPASGINA
jgi:hypothetical protein